MASSSLILHTAYLFWPLTSVHERVGWVCGRYDTLYTLPHRELLENGRLARRHHRRRLAGENISEIEVTVSEVDNSFLWHENLGAALEAQKVLYETSLLDEDRYCEPQALVYGERAEKALLEFVNLEPGSTSQAVEFVATFGAFDMPELSAEELAGSGLPPEVRQFCNDCLKPEHGIERSDPFAIPLDQFWDAQKDVLGLWRFADSLSAKSTEKVREECKNRRPGFEFVGQPDWLAIGKAILAADLSAALNASSPKPPRLLLHDREGRFIALTLCRTLRCALYMQLLKAIVSKSRHKRCLHCQEYFVPKIESQKYCKAQCQNIAKVRRSREKGNVAKNKQKTLHK